MRRCIATYKIRYRTEISAATDNLVISKENANFNGQRVYNCNYCGDWHITSSSKEKRDKFFDALFKSYNDSKFKAK